MKVFVAMIVSTGVAAAQPKPPVKQPPTVELVWVVSPLIPNPKDPKDGYPLYPVTLIVGTEKIVLKPQLGAMHSYHQSVCASAGGGGYAQLQLPEIAKITFAEGGEGGYVVQKTKTGFELLEWDQSHSLCKDPKTGQLDGCPPRKKLVRRLDVPANAKIVEKLELADKAGKRTPFDCKSDP